MAGVLGLRGTGNWATDQRPKNWREATLFIDPNGTAPLTAITSKAKNRKVDDPEYNWWTKTLPSQGGTVTNIYTDVLLASAYTSGGVAGDVLYVKMAEAVADEFRAGHQVLLRDSSHIDADVNAKVTAVVKNGANSYLSVKLLEADDNGATTDLSDCDYALIIGNINPEHGEMPESLSYDPVKYYNYTQIFRTPLKISRTARKTRLRTGDAYKEAKREALQLHMMEIEKALTWGVRSEGSGSTSQPERTTEGLVTQIRRNQSANVLDYSLDSSFSGQAWLSGGEQWFDEKLEILFRYGRKSKMAFAGSGALLGINRLAKSGGQIQLEAMAVEYGLSVTKWGTPFGTLFIMTHPLFSYDTTNQNSMVIFEPENLTFAFIDDTMFISEIPQAKSGRQGRLDGTEEEWLTECGLEYHHYETAGFFSGVGVDNSV